MIFSERYCRIGDGGHCAGSVKPRGSDKAIDRTTDDVLDEGSPFRDSESRFLSRQPEELAFVRRHHSSAKPVPAFCMRAEVAVIIAVKENLEPAFRPLAEPRCEGRAADDRGVPPMIWNDEHRHAVANVRAKYFDELIHFALETRRHVVNGSKEDTRPWHCNAICFLGSRFASPLKKLHLKFSGADRHLRAMRIADVCAFYAPSGGGVRTYVEAKLKAAARFGHEMIVIAPGERHEVIKRGPGALLVTIPSPRLPVDRRYRYFDDERMLHSVLDSWSPDHVEASSPWSSATMVGRWQGAASRSLVMHSDPLAAYAYRWLGGVASTNRIDEWFGWFWRHLRGLGRMFDSVVCANGQLACRLREGGVAKAETVRMGVEPGLFSPLLRDTQLRVAMLGALGLEADAVLLVGVGRFSAEKRWDLVIRAAGECGRDREVGLLLVGDGTKRQRLQMIAEQYRHVSVLPPILDREELARLLASSDALVHGCEAETFCLVAAEARASGIPLIVPDRGAAVDQLVPGAGTSYAAGREQSLELAIARFIERGPELQRAAAARASHVRSMDEHFGELFGRYVSLAGVHVPQPAAAMGQAMASHPVATAELALARSAVRRS